MQPAAPFINEPITPIELGPPQAGLVVAPTGFSWRGQDYKIVEVLAAAKGFGHDRSHNSPERYLDKQWFECRLDNNQIAKIYFERRNRGGRHRWWIYSLKN